MIRFVVTMFLLFCFPAAIGKAALQPEMIRVALFKGMEQVRIDGAGVMLTDEKGDSLRLNFPLQIKRLKDGLSVNGKAVRALFASAPAFVMVNGKGYRGVIECLPDSKGVLVVNELSLEEYLVGLINCEISSQWPMESIKAQAVIARSYAVYQKRARKNTLYHLESTVMDQVYEGSDIEDSRAARGVTETAGELLTFDGNVVQAFYHSNCGGHTEASENVWGYALPYLQGVDCKYCLIAPSFKWEQTLSLKKIETLLKNAGYNITGLKEVKPGRKNNSGRLTELTLVASKGGQTLQAAKFRMAIGSTVIKSTNFELKMGNDHLTLSGTGYGHGVGLCQWGAKQRAGDGFNYREILTYYYPGTKIEKIFRD